MKKPGNNKIAFIAVSIALASCIAYIAFSEYQKARDAAQFSAYQLGAEYGYEQAVLQLMQEAVKCQQVPVTYNNQTLHLVAVECIQQQNASG